MADTIWKIPKLASLISHCTYGRGAFVGVNIGNFPSEDVNFFKSVRMSAIASWQRWGPIGLLEIDVFVDVCLCADFCCGL